MPFALGVLTGLALGSAILYVHRHPHRRPEPDVGLILLTNGDAHREQVPR